MMVKEGPRGSHGQCKLTYFCSFFSFLFFFFYSTSCLSAAGRTRKMPFYYSCWTVLPHPSGNRTPIFLKGIVFLLSTHTSISSRAGDSGQASQNVSVPWQQWPAVPGSVSPEWTNESQSSTGVAREPCENGRSEVMFRRIESWERGRSWPPEVEGHPHTHHAGGKIMQGIEEERSRVGQGGLWMLQWEAIPMFSAEEG